jgi:hypothetical protein
MSKEKIRILYLEDIAEIHEKWLVFIRKAWGEDCCGSRSREKAIQIIEEGFKPDLVIFDRGILYYEDDERENDEAGDSLYYYLLKRGISTVIFSGYTDLEYLEPYASNPPLGFFTKPVDEVALRSAVDLYIRRRQEAS